MGIIRLNNEEIDLLEGFKKLPLSDQVNVSGLVCDLFKMLQSENRPSRETIATIISSAKHSKITRACYMATLAGVDWGWGVTYNK